MKQTWSEKRFICTKTRQASTHQVNWGSGAPEDNDAMMDVCADAAAEIWLPAVVAAISAMADVSADTLDDKMESWDATAAICDPDCV